MSLISFLWTPISWLWEKCPWWVKFPALITIGPNLIVNFIIFYGFLIPFITHQFNVMARPLEDARVQQLNHHLEMETLRYNLISEQMKEFRQQQSLMYQSQLDIASRLPRN